MNTPRIMLFSPIRVDAPTLSLVLQSHRALAGVSARVYHDDNTDDESKLLLQWESAQHGAFVTSSIPDLQPLNLGDEYRSEETHTWTQERISRIARIRNAAIEAFLASGCDFLFMVDADVVLHPQTVEHLVSLNLPVVSEVFWTKWQTNGVYTPQVWDVHPYGHKDAESVVRLRDVGTYEVGGLGACTLMSRAYLAKGVDYTPIPSLDMEGEDRHHCIKAQALGFKLFADTHFPPFHVYRPSQLDEARIWFEQGCDPSYFTTAWLDAAWEQRVRAAWELEMRKTRPESLAVCIPGETFSGAWVSNFMQMFTALAPKIDLQVFNVWSSNPSVTRQALAHTVLNSGRVFDYVLWIDDDNLLNAEHVGMMLDGLRAYPTIDLIAGWCDVTREFKDMGDNVVSCGVFTPEGRCAHSITQEDMESAQGFVDIQWTGFPGVMMRYALLARLTARAFVPIFDEALEWGFYGEDASFSKHAHELGAVMVADPRVKIPHIKLRDANKPTVKTLVQK